MNPAPDWKRIDRATYLALLVGTLGLCKTLPGQSGAFNVRAHYDKAEHMVPMRDGVKLFTIVYTPKKKDTPVPIMLVRTTPYSIGPYGKDNYKSVLGPTAEFDRGGYIFAFQDVRGKFKSEGSFQVMRPLRDKSKPNGTDESTDNYDAIDWLLKNVPGNNGKVGQWGISYPGWQTVLGMVDAHPALRASSPQASPSDMFIGDDWHHNGAFRLMYAFSWLSRNARSREGPTQDRAQRFRYGTPWGYRFFMEIGPIARINELYFHNRVPAWNEFMEHGTYDDYWQKQNALTFLDGVKHPILNVAGWFDAEDFYGPMSIYYEIEKRNPKNASTLVVGPWLHGGWRSMSGASLGDIRFGSNTSKHFQSRVQLPFFEHHLKGKKGWTAPEAVVFETGTNVWKQYDSWPPPITHRQLYLRGSGKLSFDQGASESASANFDSFVSDPEKPVPFSSEIRTTQGHLWMIEDQRFAATRPDVLVYETDVLTEDVTIAGPILANLFVSTTGTDADFVVKLIDVLPGDAPKNPETGAAMGHFQMLLAGEVFRAKFRESFTNPTPLIPGRVTKLSFDLRDRYHTFRKGHRIMVQIQSSWFPVIDRNPQKFVNIYEAKPEDFVKATHRVFRSGTQHSHITLGVMKR